ncbi:hypothetical protein [Alteromonas lipotrueae]|nr:hypothetical protein [Alteromonas lipotrueae]
MPKLHRQIEQAALLPKAKHKFVSELLDTVIQRIKKPANAGYVDLFKL